MMLASELLVVVGGLFVSVAVVRSAVRTVTVPRGEPGLVRKGAVCGLRLGIWADGQGGAFRRVQGGISGSLRPYDHAEDAVCVGGRRHWWLLGHVLGRRFRISGELRSPNQSTDDPRTRDRSRTLPGRTRSLAPGRSRDRGVVPVAVRSRHPERRPACPWFGPA